MVHGVFQTFQQSFHAVLKMVYSANSHIQEWIQNIVTLDMLVDSEFGVDSAVSVISDLSDFRSTRNNTSN